MKSRHAKARLSEVIERAQTEPQIITRHGTPSAVIVSAEEWARKTARDALEIEVGSAQRRSQQELGERARSAA